jgi:hypothetical protein
VVVSRAVVNLSDLARQQASSPARVQGPKTQPPERERPPRKPLPPGGIIKLAPGDAARPSAPTAVGPPAPRTVLLSSSFPAEADNSTVLPPDTQGTVGPNHLVVTLNSNVVVEDRFGNRLTTVSLDSFWAPTSNSVTTDPRVAYDPYNDRWIIATSGDFLKSTSGVLVGVSQTGDPTGNWNLYKVAVDGTGLHFCDFPTLGFNKKWVVVMCNVFANAQNSNFFSGNIYVFDKFSLYSHGPGVPVVLNDNIDNNPNGGDSNVTPALTYDNNLDTEYLVEEYNGNDTTSRNGLMRLWAISGDVNSPALSTIAFPATSVTWDEGTTLANFAPQLGATTGIDVGDARIGNVIYNNGTLWTTHPVFYPCCAPTSPPNRSAIQWWQIDTGGNVLQRGVIDNPDGSYFRSYPSIAVNQYNDALIGYARFSASEYAGGFYSFRADTDPPGVLEAETAVKTGEAPYVKTGSGGGTSNRWGDYSNTSIDPVDNISFWTIQEYAAAPASHWATWWGQVVLPGAAFQVSLTPSTTTVTAGAPLADVAVTVVDAQGHPASAYTGTVHFTSTDPRFSLPDYTFVPSDQGTHHFAGVRLFTAGPQNITMNDAVNSIQATVNFTVLPGPPSAFSLSGQPTTIQAGTPFTFSVTVQDAFQNTVTSYAGTVHFTSTDSRFSLPDYTFVPSDQGTRNFAGVRLFTAGPQSITLKDAVNSIQATANFTVLPGAAIAFSLSGQPTTSQAGTPFTFSVTVQDTFQNTVTSYSGTVQFTTSDPIGTVPGSYTFVPGSDNGTHMFPATLRRAGAQNIAVSAGNIAASMNITVTAASAQSLIVSAPASATIGRPFTLTVITQDAYKNVATGYQGTVQFSTSDPSPSLPPNYPFTTGDKGIHYFNAVTLNTIGTQTVTVTDTVTNSITGSASVNVAHLSGVPRIVRLRLGQPFNLTLADFTDDQNTSSFSADIDWGDGSGHTTGTISGGSGSYSIADNHAYTRPPERPITITITDTTHGYPPLSIIVPVHMWPRTESH